LTIGDGGILPVGNGGTGANAAATALVNLGAQARVTGSCTDGGTISAIDANGGVTCSRPTVPRLVGPAAMPTSPADGDEVDYLPSATAGVVWRFRFNSSSASVYKWEFVGGSELRSDVAASDMVTSTAYAPVATSGPSLVLPLGGEFNVEIGCYALVALASADAVLMSVFDGTNMASDGDAAAFEYGTPGSAAATVTMSMMKAWPGPLTLSSQYRVLASSGSNMRSVARRWMRVRPIRVH
jgi:hypothetical protein